MVTDIENQDKMEDGDVLFGALESGAEILVRGSGIDLDSNLRHEGGADNWTVRCECGARDDGKETEPLYTRGGIAGKQLPLTIKSLLEK